MLSLLSYRANIVTVEMVKIRASRFEARFYATGPAPHTQIVLSSQRSFADTNRADRQRKVTATDMPRKLRQGLAKRSDRGAHRVPLRDSPSFLVRLAQLGVFDEFYRHFAGLSMTPARFSVFALIVTNPGVRPGTLAEELRVKPSNVAGLVNSLVADGLVKRQQDKAELRANELRPTKAGLKAFKEMWEIHCNLDKLLLEPLSASERKVFVQLMQKLDSV